MGDSPPHHGRAHHGGTLIAGGVIDLAGASIGQAIVLLGLGMTLYSIVKSSGYYVQRHELPPVVMFAALFVLTAVAAGAQLRAIA